MDPPRSSFHCPQGAEGLPSEDLLPVNRSLCWVTLGKDLAVPQFPVCKMNLVLEWLCPRGFGMDLGTPLQTATSAIPGSEYIHNSCVRTIIIILPSVSKSHNLGLRLRSSSRWKKSEKWLFRSGHGGVCVRSQHLRG